MGVKHTVLPDGQSPAVAFTVLAQLCGPKANDTEMGVALLMKNGEGLFYRENSKGIIFRCALKEKFDGKNYSTKYGKYSIYEC